MYDKYQTGQRFFTFENEIYVIKLFLNQTMYFLLLDAKNCLGVISILSSETRLSIDERLTEGFWIYNILQKEAINWTSDGE